MAGDRTIPTCKRLLLSLAALGLAAPVAAHADARAYVRARAAAADGAVETAAIGYAAAMAAAPGDEVVALRTYRNALASGDLMLARRAAGALRQAGNAPADVSILDLADAIRTGNRATADDALGRIGAGPLDFLAPVIRAWLAFDRGGDPLPILDAARGSGLGQRYVAEHRALLLIASKRIEEGVAALRATTVADPGNFDLRWNAASLLAARGERERATALLAGDDSELASLRARLRKAKPNAAFGASRLFSRLAADLAGQQAEPLVIVLTRAALSLDPDHDRARLLLADALREDQADVSALAILAQVPHDSAFYATAQTERIELIKARGEDAAALSIADSLASRAGAMLTDKQRYADLLADQGREADAARIYADILKMANTEVGWVHHLQLGGALERAGHWQAALPHLRKAVELAPDQPIALNYLGYALVDRGEDMTEGRALLERASKLRPGDPAITDSLGWAYFRMGEHERALPLLERAAQGSATSATINEHLGDAYWQAGRRFEARYAWRAAALLAEGEQQGRITEKLSEGLKSDAPVSRQRNQISRWIGVLGERRASAN